MNLFNFSCGSVLLVLCVKMCVTLTMFANNSSYISIDAGDTFGLWGKLEWCPDGMYAVGYEQKIQRKSRTDDNSALNGIGLICGNDTNGSLHSKNSITSSVGPFGEWNGPIFCPKGSFLVGFSMQIQPHVSDATIDETGSQFITFRCQDSIDNTKVQDLVQYPGYWQQHGYHTRTSQSCKQGTRICGIKTQIQYFYEPDTDNTGLNDVLMVCCVWGTDF